jgi:hypothetical protein
MRVTVSAAGGVTAKPTAKITVTQGVLRYVTVNGDSSKAASELTLRAIAVSYGECMWWPGTPSHCAKSG